jgi:hypothetical protein
VRVLTVATGALEHELDAHAGGVGWRALATLGGDIIVSGGHDDGRVATWNAARGERLGEVAAGVGVRALAAIDSGRFVAGTKSGDVVFYTHHGGSGVEEAALIPGAHRGPVNDFAVCGGRLATASNDGTAAVWGVDSRKPLARLSGHGIYLNSVDMSNRLVVTASNDKTVRVYNAERGYSCVAVLDWIHTLPVNFVCLIGADHILSASDDATVCVTELSSGAVVARTELNYFVNCAATLPDGRLDVCGRRGSATLIDAPAAAADILKAHGAAAFPEAVAASPALSVADSLPRLQDAVVRVAAGEQTATAACRDLISADSCSSSLAEWSAGHLLLMTAVRGGEIEASQIFNGVRNYWFDTLYVPSRKLCLGTEDYEVVKLLLEEAKAAGVIETVEASLAAIASHNDLKVNVNELRSAGEQMLRAIAHIFMRQADMEQRLCDLENGFERFKRVQQWTQLANIVFSLIPFAGGAITCVIAGAAPVLDGMQISNVVQSLLGVIAGNQALATAPLFKRFLSSGNVLLSEDGLAVMPVDARVLLERVASELGLSMEGLRQILKVTAQRMAEDREVRCPSVSVEVLGEEDDEVEGKEDAESSTESMNGSEVDDLGDRFEGATTHERLSAPVASASENASPPDSECDSTRAGGARLEGRRDDQDVYRETLNFLLGVEDDETGAQRFATKLNLLRERGVTAELVSRMDHTELAVSMAAHMVVYVPVRLPQFVKLRGCLVETFIELSIFGLALVGDHAIPADEVFELVVDGLSTSNIFRSIAGYKWSLRRFLENVYGGSRD